jgi:broad specificity phosphatase PhoE
MAHAWKACWAQALGGSNPPLSAIKRIMKTTLYVVRHGESEHNRDNIVSGHVNPALTEKGKAQALLTRQKLSHVRFDEAYSSDLQRAVHTGALIYGQEVPAAHQLFDLRERNYGVIDGASNDDYIAIKQANQKLLDNLDEAEQWLFKHADDIESDHELSSRFISAITHIAQSNDGKTILVAAHGGVMRTMLIKLGYATSQQLPARTIENAAFIELIYESGMLHIGQLSGINKLRD